MRMRFLRKLSKILLLLALINAVFSSTAIVHADLIRKDPDIAGKIIDIDTREPISGAVVMAMWTTETFRLTIESKTEYHDYFETLTNEWGEFTIPGKGLIILRNIQPPKLKIFKGGYPILSLHYWGNYIDRSYQELYPDSRKVEWVDGKLVISIRKISKEERKKAIKERRIIPFSGMGFVSHGKFHLYTEAVSKEYHALGLTPSWEIDHTILRVKQGGVYPAGEMAVRPRNTN